MMSMENVDQFLSVNYIVDLTRSKAPMGLEAAYQLLKDRYQEPVIDITREQRDVCNEIESELAKTGQLGWRTYAEELCLLFKRLHSSIPRTPLESLNIGEDSFAHDSVDPFWRYQFLESNGYEIRWADTADAGSTARRGAGRGRKPDLSLKKSGHTVCHVEIKRPIKTRAPKAFLEDYFKLAMLCKDTIDEAGRQRCAARKCSAVQYHGKWDLQTIFFTTRCFCAVTILRLHY
ncbi:MAG: hypothetical protein BYD32DRAFT_27325 [Podila humilis]|nr:MAG: hypothetical protein BYD32DRAFT_27325 [Podila humilis]